MASWFPSKARTDARSLRGATIPEVGGPWKKYSLPLHARAANPNARLVITMDEPGDIWFDTVSLFPRKTFKDRSNGLRPDLARMLADLHPGFLRFPGGCVVEGITLANRIRWKDSIGDISQRQGGFDVWGYYNTGAWDFMSICNWPRISARNRCMSSMWG